VAGFTDGALPGQTSAGSRDAFVRKYDSAGILLWTRQFGSSDFDDASGVAVDTGGNVLVAGTTDGTLPGQTSAGGFDAFVRKYDAAGTLLWTRQFGSSSFDDAFGVAVDTGGNVLVAGYTNGALPVQTSAGGFDAFVRKYDSAGTLLWTRQFGSSMYDAATGVAVDPGGNVLVAGYIGGVLPGQTSAGSRDAFVRKYDSAGTLLWTRQFGSSADDSGSGVAVDIGGNVLVAGSTKGALPGQTSSGGQDAFYVHLPPQ
jgi:hypothetical protein